MFRQTFRLLFDLRFRLAGRSLQHGGANRLAGLGVLLIFLLPAGIATGSNAFHWLQDRHVPYPLSDRLALVLSGVWAAWLISRFAPEGLTATGSGRIPLSLLRSYPGHPLGVVLAETAGGFADLPLLLAAPALIAVGRASSANFAIAPLALVLLLAQASFLQIVASQAAIRLWQGRARAFLQPAIRFTILCLIVLAAGIRFSTASTSRPPEIHLWKTPAQRAAEAEAAARIRKHLPGWVSLTPAGMAAQALSGDTGQSFLALVELALVTAATGVAAAALVRVALTSPNDASADSGRQFAARLLPSRAYETSANGGTVFAEIGTIAATEWRALVRAPRRHIPLRGPAMMIFVLFFCWLAPDLGSDALQNLYDFVGMGGMLYVLLWQIQFQCNRFGNETGTASLLFSLPVRRQYILAGRNLALGALLLIVDSAGVLLGSAMAHATAGLTAAMLCCVPAVIALTTSLGNVLSMYAPFPIGHLDSTQPPEPGRGLAFAYGTVAALNIAFLFGVFRLPVAALVLAAIYAASLRVSEWEMRRRERRIIAAFRTGETGQ